MATMATERPTQGQADNQWPALRVGRPISYRGDVVAIMRGEEVFADDNLSQADLRVVRAMVRAAWEAPQADDNQLLLYAGYLLLPEDLLDECHYLGDEALARLRGLPTDFVRIRRRLPRLTSHRRF